MKINLVIAQYKYSCYNKNAQGVFKFIGILSSSKQSNRHIRCILKEAATRQPLLIFKALITYIFDRTPNQAPLKYALALTYTCLLLSPFLNRHHLPVFESPALVKGLIFAFLV